MTPEQQKLLLDAMHAANTEKAVAEVNHSFEPTCNKIFMGGLIEKINQLSQQNAKLSPEYNEIKSILAKEFPQNQNIKSTGFSLDPHNFHIGQKNGAGGRNQNYDISNGQYLPGGLAGLAEKSQAKKSSLVETSLVVDHELFSLGTTTTPCKLWGMIPGYIIATPLDCNIHGEYDGQWSTEFKADSEIRFNLTQGSIPLGTNKAQLNYVADLGSISFSSTGEVSLNKGHVVIEGYASAGITGPSVGTNFSLETFNFLGLQFACSGSAGGGVGAKVNVGGAANFDPSRAIFRFHAIFGFYAGVGGNVSCDGVVQPDTELLNRAEKRAKEIESNNPLFRDMVSEFKEALREAREKKSVHPEGSIRRKLEDSWNRYVVSCYEEDLSNWTQPTATAGVAVEMLPHFTKEETVPPPAASFQDPSIPLNKPDMDEPVLPEPPSPQASKNILPDVATPTISMPMKELLGQELNNERKAKLSTIPESDNSKLHFNKQTLEDSKRYFGDKIKQDAERARLQVPPSVPSRANSGFMNGFSIKDDVHGQKGIHYDFNHADADNPHGMKIEFGISFRAIFGLLKVASAALNRAKNYTDKQKDTYSLMKFMSRSDGTEASCLEFEQRLGNAKLSAAEKKHFRFVFYTGNTEELLNLKEMILDKNAEMHTKIRSQLQSWTRESTWERNNPEDNLSRYTDIQCSLLQQTVDNDQKQGIYSAIGQALYHPDSAEIAIHTLCKESREKTFKDVIEPKLKKALEEYTRAKSGKREKKAQKFEEFVEKNKSIYYDEMANYQLKFHRQRGQESDWLKARDLLRQQNKLKDADNITHDLAKKFAQNKSYIEQSGIAYAKQGDFDKAMLQWEKLDVLSGGSINLLYRQLEQLDEDKKYPEARALCEKFIATQKTADDNFYYMHLYVSLCFDNNDYATGISELEKLMADYGNDRDKYEKTAGVLLNAYGLQAQKNEVPISELTGEWIDKILGDTAFSDLNTILSVLKFTSMQGNNEKAMDCLKQCRLGHTEASESQRKDMDAALAFLLDKAMCSGKYEQVDEIQQEVGNLSHLPTVDRMFKEIANIRTLSIQSQSGQTVEAGTEVGLMVACKLNDARFREIAVSIFAFMKGTTTALVASASEWLEFSIEKYRLNRILDFEFLPDAEREKYTTQLTDLENKSFLASSGTYHALSSILQTGKRWHEAFYRSGRDPEEKLPMYANLDTIILASDSIASYLDAQALTMDWEHKIDMANLAIQATRLVIDTLVAVDQLAEEHYGQSLGLRENAWVKNHLPESVRLASSAVAIAKDLNPVTAAVHGVAMLAPHLLPDSYLNTTTAELINKGEYLNGNGYISSTALVGGFKNASKLVGSGTVISASVATGKAVVAGAMSIPQVAAAAGVVSNAAVAGGAFVATHAAAGATAASAAISAQAAAIMAIPQVAATAAAASNVAAAGSALVATNAAAVGAAIGSGATAASAAISAQAATVMAIPQIAATAATASNMAAAGSALVATNAAALGSAIGSGAATAGGVAYSCVSGIGASTGITAAVEAAIPIVSAQASALAAGTWNVMVAAAPVVGGMIVVVGAATVGYQIYCCQYDENTKQFYVNAHIAINEVNFERASEEMAKYASRTQPAENQLSWTEQLAAMTPQILADYIVSDLTAKNILEKKERQSKHENAAGECAKEKTYENTEVHDTILSTKNYELSLMPENPDLLKPKSNKVYLSLKDGKILYRTKLSDSKNNKKTQELSIENLIQRETNPNKIQKLRDIMKMANSEEAIKELQSFLSNILTVAQEKGHVEARKVLTLTELDEAIEQTLKHIEKHPSLQGAADDLVSCEYKKLKIFEKEESEVLKARMKTVNDAIQFLDNAEAEITQAKAARLAHLDKIQPLMNQINKHSPYRGYDIFLMNVAPSKENIKKDAIYLYFDKQELKYVVNGSPAVVLKTVSPEEQQKFKENNALTSNESCKKIEDYSSDFMRAILFETTKNGHTRFFLNRDVRDVAGVTEEQEKEKEKDPILQCHALQDNSLLPVQYTASRIQTTQIFIDGLRQICGFLEYNFSRFNENGNTSIYIEKSEGKLLYKIKNIAENQEITQEDFISEGVDKNQIELFFEELNLSSDWLEMTKKYKKEIFSILSKRGHVSAILNDSLIKLEKFSSFSALMFDLTQLVKTLIERQIACLLDSEETQRSESMADHFVRLLQSQISLITDYHSFRQCFGYDVSSTEYQQEQEYWKNYILPCIQMAIAAATIFSCRHDPWKVAKELSRIFFNIFKIPHVRRGLLTVDEQSLQKFNGYFFFGQFLESLDSNVSTSNVLSMNANVFNFWTKAPDYIRGFLTTLISWERYGNRYFIDNTRVPSNEEAFSFSMFGEFSENHDYFDRFVLILQGVNIFFSLADTTFNYKKHVLQRLIKQSIEAKNKSDTAYYYGLLYENENNISEAMRCYKEAMAINNQHAKATKKIKQLGALETSAQAVTVITHDAFTKEEDSRFRRAIMGISVLAIAANPASVPAYFLGSIVFTLAQREELDRNTLMQPVRHLIKWRENWSKQEKPETKEENNNDEIQESTSTDGYETDESEDEQLENISRQYLKETRNTVEIDGFIQVEDVDEYDSNDELPIWKKRPDSLPGKRVLNDGFNTLGNNIAFWERLTENGCVVEPGNMVQLATRRKS